jgi:predicted SAM-dependent methyltransferase
MISSAWKTTYFRLMRLPMRLNGMIYKCFRSPRAGLVKVHLGPGQGKYLPGWINLDANFITARLDLWADLRNPLPFRDRSVDAFYSYHVVEHLPDALLPAHFRELYRCLKPGGAIRIGCPSGDGAIQKFVEGDAAWFGDWPDKRRSVGGRLVNFLLCRGEHLSILTYSYLEELASDAGFTEFAGCKPRYQTRFGPLMDSALLASEEETPQDPPMTLVIEAKKSG